MLIGSEEAPNAILFAKAGSSSRGGSSSSVESAPARAAGLPLGDDGLEDVDDLFERINPGTAESVGDRSGDKSTFDLASALRHSVEQYGEPSVELPHLHDC